MGWLVFVSLMCLGAVIYVLRRAQSTKPLPHERDQHQDRHAA